MKKKVLILGLMSLAIVDARGSGNFWPLDSLRARAVSNNKSLLMTEQKKTAAHYAHKSATTNVLPRVSATAAYMYTSRELSLLNDEQKHIIQYRFGTFRHGTRSCSYEPATELGRTGAC